jgi:GABA(A) receptor-associated protein
MDFKTKNNFTQRCGESKKIMNKYPQRVPIIVEKCDKSQINDIDKNKYLVPKDLNMNQFIYIIRKRIKLDKSQSIFLMINNTVCPSNTPIGVIYEENKDDDGFLYIKYTSENTFG